MQENLTFAVMRVSSISTNRRPGHCRRPTPNGTTRFAPASVHRLFVFVSSISQRSGWYSSGSLKLSASWHEIMFWHKTTVYNELIKTEN